MFDKSINFLATNAARKRKGKLYRTHRAFLNQLLIICENDALESKKTLRTRSWIEICWNIQSNSLLVSLMRKCSERFSFGSNTGHDAPSPKKLLLSCEFFDLICRSIFKLSYYCQKNDDSLVINYFIFVLA